MYRAFGVFLARYWAIIIVGWLVLAAAMDHLAPPWDSVTHDGDLAYLPRTMTSVRGEELLARAFPNNRARSQIVLVVARRDALLQNGDYRVAEWLAERFAPGNCDLPVLDVLSRQTTVLGSKMQSPDQQATIIVVRLSSDIMTLESVRVLDQVNAALDEARRRPDFPPGLELGVTGSAAIGGDMLVAAVESIENTEVATIVLVVAILLAVYRAPLLVLVPMATIAISVSVAMDLVALMTLVPQQAGFEWFDFKVFKSTKIFIIVILYGAGTDFCLFLIARYREELEHGLDRSAALANTMAGVSDAILGSALTTILGLGMMLFASFGKFRNSGPAIAFCLVVALAASMTLAPALLRAFGAWVFWPFGIRARTGGDLSALGGAAIDPLVTAAPHGNWVTRFWEWASRHIVAYPGTILATSVLLLLPLAYEGLSVPISYDLVHELPADRASVLGTELFCEHFPAGETGPIGVVAYNPNAHFDTEEGEHEIARLTKLLFEIDGVTSVRSIAEPLGDAPGLFNPFSSSGRNKLLARKHPRTEEIYLTQVDALVGKVARFDVVMEYDPFSPRAMEVLTTIDRRLAELAADRSSPWHGSVFDLVGTTSATRDLKAVTEADQVLIQRLVVIVVLATLIVILRRPMISVYLIVSVLLSYFVTIGLTELVFAWWLPNFSGLDWKVPLFLFVILVAVGEDYNIYLLTRVIEEERRLGPLEGLRSAVVRTGGIITSCGLIMAGTFVSMMFGTLRGILEMGFALSVGVLLDTFIVRPILVPAFLALLHRYGGRYGALTRHAPETPKLDVVPTTPGRA